MTNIHESYAGKLRFELATSGSAVRRAAECAMEPGKMNDNQTQIWKSAGTSLYTTCSEMTI